MSIDFVDVEDKETSLEDSIRGLNNILLEMEDFKDKDYYKTLVSIREDMKKDLEKYQQLLKIEDEKVQKELEIEYRKSAL
jgi:hypothetical protein